MSTEEPHKVELTLSRSCYNIGDTIVGTIRLIRGSNASATKKRSQSLPSKKYPSGSIGTQIAPFTDAIVYVSGKCRIDPRWHNKKQVIGLYGTHPILNSLPIQPEQKSSSQAKQSVCFFATNYVDLLELIPESRSNSNKIDHCNDVNLSNVEDIAMKSSILRRVHSGTCTVERDSVGFTFRVDLPDDIPPSTNAICCKYFYTVVVSARIDTGKIITIETPFILQSSALILHNPYNNVRTLHLQQQSNDSCQSHSRTRIKIGHCIATPHLPPPPSPLMLANSHTSQIAVSRTSGLCSIASTADLRSIRVTNQEGIPCCILTIVGAKIMTPGGKLLLQFHFEPEVVLGLNQQMEMNDDGNYLLSCLQIGACIYGEELAISNNDETRKNKTRGYIFDTAYSMIESGCNDTVAMILSLPLDCPCSLKTDIVEMNIYCKVELTVKGSKNSKGRNKIETLRLELPCDVVHNFVDVEDEMEGEDLGTTSPTDVFLLANREKRKKKEQGQHYNGKINMTGVLNDNYDVFTKDIFGDLTMLSLRLVDSGVLDTQI